MRSMRPGFQTSLGWLSRFDDHESEILRFAQNDIHEMVCKQRQLTDEQVEIWQIVSAKFW
jgi:hypothetical protein